ncbi:unnamed protein product, partial [Prorocentrum cordatum]
GPHYMHRHKAAIGKEQILRATALTGVLLPARAKRKYLPRGHARKWRPHSVADRREAASRRDPKSVAFELSAGVPASAARAPGLERETAPSSGEARRLRRRAGSHVDSKEKKKSESSGRRPRAGDSGTGRAGTAGRNSARKRKARCSHDLLTAEGKADVRHAHGPGSTALELWPCELAQARATGIKTKTKKRGGGCEAGGKGQRG